MMARAEDISVDINAYNDQIGVSFTKEDECLKRQALTCMGIHIDDIHDCLGYSNSEEFSRKEEYKYFQLSYFTTPSYCCSIDDCFLITLLFPETYLYFSRDLIPMSVQYWDYENWEYSSEIDDSDIKIIDGEFDLDIYDPKKMVKLRFYVETHEETGTCFKGTIHKAPIVYSLKRSYPSKKIIRSVIEQSTAKGYTELTALLLEKCKDI